MGWPTGRAARTKRHLRRTGPKGDRPTTTREVWPPVSIVLRWLWLYESFLKTYFWAMKTPYLKKLEIVRTFSSKNKENWVCSSIDNDIDREKKRPFQQKKIFCWSISWMGQLRQKAKISIFRRLLRAVGLSDGCVRRKPQSRKAAKATRANNPLIVFSSQNTDNNNDPFLQRKIRRTEAKALVVPSTFQKRPSQEGTPPPLFLNSLKKITIYIAEKREFQIGDKISGRHGNKGIISQIFSNADMPYLSNGCTLDVLLNPLGVPSRMNVGQILECLLGFTGQIFHTKFRVLCFDEIYGYESSRSFIYSKLFELCKKTRQKLFLSKKTPGKFNLFDGRNGQLFYQSITVGSTYLMKLIHVVDEKIHARGTGPYSLITQQPLRGRAKHGGQRIGEMEVWALQGFGSAYTLQELLTVKSDDLYGRNQILQTLLKNTPLRFGTPESLRVVLRELQCLCLDLQLSDTQ